MADHDCPMAPTYATADAYTYCGHPSHDGPATSLAPAWVGEHAFYSELNQCMCCGNCGIPVDRHGEKCGEWLEASDT